MSNATTPGHRNVAWKDEGRGSGSLCFGAFQTCGGVSGKALR